MRLVAQIPVNVSLLGGVRLQMGDCRSGTGGVV
jgi:hypothetical protein